MGTTLRITAHPDLLTSQATESDLSLVLLGYMLDPYRPGDLDGDILRRLLHLLEEGGTRESLIRATYPLGGRWILIVDAGQDRWLFHDPCGHRQIFYTVDPQPLWCASQPGMLAEILGLRMSREASRFYRTYRRRDPQYAWPGDTSPYREVRRLPPNHALDLGTRTVSRFWPPADVAPRATDDVVRENAGLLRGIIESASRRFALSLGITAGRDTRTVLAASAAIHDRLYCFTSMYWHMNWDTADIRVPSRLLGRLGVPHHVIVCPSRTDGEFGRIYRQNVPLANDCYGPIVQGDYQSNPPDRVCMMGYGMPITIAPYRHRLKRWRPQTDLGNVDVETLAWCAYRDDPFSLEAIARWLSGAPRTNIHVLDLFYWEEREGSWEATGLAEWDLCREAFAPFDCRLFLTNALAIPESYRCRPTYFFHESLMRQLWPEVLSEPFNPPDGHDLYSTVCTSMSQLREKIDGKAPSTMGRPVVRIFQRRPWLTDLARVGWMKARPGS